MTGDLLPIVVFLILLVIILVACLVRAIALSDKRASARFDQWRESLLEMERATLRRSAQAELEAWKANEELRIRADALDRSDHTHFGKITEHLVPWLADTPFDPRDMRFIGSPVDFTVFDGLSAGKDVTITFVEVKTGKNARLTAREERVRDAVLAGRVNYRILRIQRPVTTRDGGP